MIRLFSRPDPTLFEESYWTVWSITVLEGMEGMLIVPATSIKAVVAVIPHNHHVMPDNSDKRYFVWEKMGLDMGLLSDGNKDYDGGDEDEEE